MIYLLAQIMEIDGTTFGDVGLFQLKNITIDEIRKIKKEPYLQFEISDKMELLDLDVCYENQNKRELFNKIERRIDATFIKRGFKKISINSREIIYFNDEVLEID